MAYVKRPMPTGHIITEDDMDYIQGQYDAAKEDIDAHAERTDNPHEVTKTQVGLGNVDNMSATSIRTDTSRALRTEVVSSFPSHADGKIIYHTEDKKFYGSSDGEWV